MIEVGEEVEKVFYEFPVELDEKEMIRFFEYARENMSEETFERIMVEWALEDLIEKKTIELLNEWKP